MIKVLYLVMGSVESYLIATGQQVQKHISNVEGKNVYNHWRSIIKHEDFPEKSDNRIETGWYENGNQRCETHYKNGKKHGSSIGWYIDGTLEWDFTYEDGEFHGTQFYWEYTSLHNGLLYKYIYKHGKKDGHQIDNNYLYRSQEDNDPISIQRSGSLHTFFVDGVQQGMETLYHKNGVKLWEVNYVDGKREGVFLTRNMYGNESSLVYYFNGKREGKITKWYNNKQVKLVGCYTDDKKEGDFLVWTIDGKLWQCFHHKGDYLLTKDYYPNGQLQCFMEFEDKKHINTVTKWYENGQKMEEIPYNNYKTHGIVTSWYSDGKVSGVYRYNNGEFQDGKSWHNNGLIKSISDCKDIFTYREWDEKGNFIKETNTKTGLYYTEIGYQMIWKDNVRTETICHENGVRQIKEWYMGDKGILGPKADYTLFRYRNHGLYKTWYSIEEGNKIKSKLNYKCGKLDGEQFLWHENGKCWSTSWYINDEIHGNAYEYLSNGELSHKWNFHYGKLHGLQIHCRGKDIKTWYIYGVQVSIDDYNLFLNNH